MSVDTNISYDAKDVFEGPVSFTASHDGGPQFTATGGQTAKTSGIITKQTNVTVTVSGI